MNTNQINELCASLKCDIITIFPNTIIQKQTISAKDITKYITSMSEKSINTFLLNESKNQKPDQLIKNLLL